MDRYEITIRGADIRVGAFDRKATTVKHVVKASTIEEAMTRALKASPGRLDAENCRELPKTGTYVRWDGVNMAQVASLRGRKQSWGTIANTIGCAEETLKKAFYRRIEENSEAAQ